MSQFLSTIELPGAPKRPDCLAWSSTGELAAGIGNTVHLSIPNQTHSPQGDRPAKEPAWHHAQFEVEFPTDGWAGEELAPQNDFFVGREQATVDIITLIWSPPVLVGGRCALGVLTSNGIVGLWEPGGDMGGCGGWGCTLSTREVLRLLEDTPAGSKLDFNFDVGQEGLSKRTKVLRGRIQQIAWRRGTGEGSVDFLLANQNDDEHVCISLSSERESGSYAYEGLRVSRCYSEGTAEHRRRLETQPGGHTEGSYVMKSLSQSTRMIRTMEELEDAAKNLMPRLGESHEKQELLDSITASLGDRVRKLSEEYCSKQDIKRRSDNLDIRVWADASFEDYLAVFVTISFHGAPHYITATDVRSYIVFLRRETTIEADLLYDGPEMLFPWEQDFRVSTKDARAGRPWSFGYQAQADAMVPSFDKVRLNGVFVVANLFASLLAMSTYAIVGQDDNHLIWIEGLVTSLAHNLAEHGSAVSDLIRATRRRHAPLPPSEQKAVTTEIVRSINNYVDIRSQHELKDLTAFRYVEYCPVEGCSLPVYWRSLTWAECRNGHVTERCPLTCLAMLNPYHKKHCERCTRAFLSESKLVEFYDEAARRGIIPSKQPLSYKDLVAERLLRCPKCPYCGGRFKQSLAVH